jgi:hypothetical protein
VLSLWLLLLVSELRIMSQVRECGVQGGNLQTRMLLLVIAVSVRTSAGLWRHSIFLVSNWCFACCCC